MKLHFKDSGVSNSIETANNLSTVNIFIILWPGAKYEYEANDSAWYNPPDTLDVCPAESQKENWLLDW